MSYDFSFFLADSATMMNIGEIDDTTGKSLQVMLNKGGAFKFNMPTFHSLALNVMKIKTCVRCVMDGIDVWSGPVFTMSASLGAKSMSIGCVGWQDTILGHRQLNPNQLGASTQLSYNAIDAGYIAHDLLGKANQRGLIIPGAPSPTFITVGTRDPSYPRNRSYDPFINIGSEIQSLSDIENGFDYLIHPTTRAMNIVYPRIGADNPELHFGFQAGPENLEDAQIDEDASRYCNYFAALGKSSGQYQHAEDVISQGDIGLWEDSAALSDVIDGNVLLAYAGQEVAFRINPLGYILKPLPYSGASDAPDVPRLFKDFVIGDTGRFSCNEGRYIFDKQPTRVFGATLGFADDSNKPQLESLTTVLN